MEKAYQIYCDGQVRTNLVFALPYFLEIRKFHTRTHARRTHKRSTLY